MLAQLAPLASLARIGPLITHQAHQLAVGLRAYAGSGRRRRTDEAGCAFVGGEYGNQLDFNICLSVCLLELVVSEWVSKGDKGLQWSRPSV